MRNDIRDRATVRAGFASVAGGKQRKALLPVVSFIDEYSAHLPVRIFCAFTPSGVFKHYLSNRGESRRTAIGFCGAIPN
jgi:hypothetical protein